MTTPSEPTTTFSVDDASADASTLPTTPIPFNFILPVPASAPARVLTHTHPVPTVLLVASPPPELTDLFVGTISSALEEWHNEALREAPGECEVCGKAKEDVLMTPVSFLGEGDDIKATAPGTEKEDEDEHIDGVVGVPEADDTTTSTSHQPPPQKRIDVLITPICSRSSCAALARAKLRRVVEGQTQPSAPTSSTSPSDPSQQPLESLFTPQDAQAIDNLAEAAQSFRRLPGPEDVRCAVCGKTKDTKKCAACGRVRYCGRECQRLDWRAGHKRVCGVGIVSARGGEE
ncbi:hypothetical protein IWZ00DRAFT_487865 [Phyllosticta capitalensis]|uniref:MYND-type domain-containing protein n=1 Tax=Phyllosticta capitalensis TaxID=121624 RepID=A0ABR1YX61_9PEZI